MILQKYYRLLMLIIIGFDFTQLNARHRYVPLFGLFNVFDKISQAHCDIIEKIFDPHKKDKQVALPEVRVDGSPWNGDNHNKPAKPNDPVIFSEIIGLDAILADIQEIVAYIKDSKKYKDLGAKPYKGILLEGPPGSGKTMIAKAIATEANCNFEYASASSFVEIYVGVGAKHVRELFDKARKSKPTIIFIDELDAIGAVNRGAGANEEYRQTLNELLCQMDGFKGEEGIIVIAATNNAKVLDSALKRAGRFDRIITVPLPNLEARLKMLEAARKKLPSVSISDEYLNQLAKDTYGLTAADLNNIFNEAALLAVRENATVVEEKHMLVAAKKIISERRK